MTSSNTTSGGACGGAGIGPLSIDYVLGITKAYTTRVGAGPFPTELFDDVGAYLAKQGNEFGATTGRPRRCGWFDAVALRRAVQINSISGLCITKLDVLDGLESIKVCVSYQVDGKKRSTPPTGADGFEACKPVYVEFPGWKESTVGANRIDDLPENARAYLRELGKLTQAEVAMVSTGPDRSQNIMIKHPFE